MAASFVTILVTDFAGSTALLAQRDTLATLRALIADHEGREVSSAGDGLVVAFDSAAAAVRCAAAMQRATDAETGPQLRIGLDAGEADAGDDQLGAPVVVAGRLCEAAEGGQILASDLVRQVAGAHVEEPFFPRGALRLRGLEARVDAAQVGWRGPEPAPEGEPRTRPIT